MIDSMLSLTNMSNGSLLLHQGLHLGGIKLVRVLTNGSRDALNAVLDSPMNMTKLYEDQGRCKGRHIADFRKTFELN